MVIKEFFCPKCEEFGHTGTTIITGLSTHTRFCWKCGTIICKWKYKEATEQ